MFIIIIIIIIIIIMFIICGLKGSGAGNEP